MGVAELVARTTEEMVRVSRAMLTHPDAATVTDKLRAARHEHGRLFDTRAWVVRVEAVYRCLAQRTGRDHIIANPHTNKV
mmetsp:Transcript_21277/g.46312  ORF Transcript_21277/g.46312 Transcript_21277/m.46312 type:complete len:80 (+) Transcript_21277:1-240(+)